MRERLRRLAATTQRRWAANPRQGVVYGIVGALVSEAGKLPEWIAFGAGHSVRWVLLVFAQEMVSVLAGAIAIIFAIRACTDNGADLLRAPLKFALLVAGASAAATSLAWAVNCMLIGDAVLELKPDRLFNFWMQAILWGGLLGWLYLLSLQRSASRLVLDTLLSRRALLANQVARAKLGRARAQFDPAMVALVLRTVHGRYRIDPAAGSLLLDRLIAYLRLAMSRRRAETNSAASEIALIRALVALREAEHGIAIELQLDDTFKPSAGAFEHVCAQLDQAIRSGRRPVRLQVAADDIQHDINNGEHDHVAIQTTGK